MDYFNNLPFDIIHSLQKYGVSLLVLSTLNKRLRNFIKTRITLNDQVQKNIFNQLEWKSLFENHQECYGIILKHFRINQNTITIFCQQKLSICIDLLYFIAIHYKSGTFILQDIHLNLILSNPKNSNYLQDSKILKILQSFTMDLTIFNTNFYDTYYLYIRPILLNYFLSRNDIVKPKSYSSSIDFVFKYNQKDSLKALINNGILTYKDALYKSITSKSENPIILKYLLSKNVPLDGLSTEYYSFISNYDIEVLDLFLKGPLFKKINIIEKERITEGAYEKCDEQILKKLLEKKIFEIDLKNRIKYIEKAITQNSLLGVSSVLNTLPFWLFNRNELLYLLSLAFDYKCENIVNFLITFIANNMDIDYTEELLSSSSLITKLNKSNKECIEKLKKQEEKTNHKTKKQRINKNN